jgi:hypothetical protein
MSSPANAFNRKVAGVTKQKDNSTFVDKVRLRNQLLRESGPEVSVLETHGGYGRVYERTWWRARRPGVVFEVNIPKAEHLARQRPSWSVYEGDSLAALQAGYGMDRSFDVIDVDPYGSCLEYVRCLFDPKRAHPRVWWLVLNCSVRQMLRLNGAWHVLALREYVERFGNSTLLWRNYEAVLQLLVADLAAASKQRVSSFRPQRRRLRGRHACAGARDLLPASPRIPKHPRQLVRLLNDEGPFSPQLTLFEGGPTRAAVNVTHPRTTWAKSKRSAYTLSG